MLQERAVVDKVVSACISGGDEGGGVAGSDDIQPETEEFGLGCRKSKRQKKKPQVSTRKLWMWQTVSQPCKTDGLQSQTTQEVALTTLHSPWQNENTIVSFKNS